MAKKIRIGIIGLGGVAQAHLQAFDLLDCLTIVGVCDIRLEAAQAVAEKYHASAYSDYHEMLKHEQVDLILVLTPASTHREVVEAVAAVGIHVFCEKPIAVTAEDAEAMLDACREAKVKFFYGSCYRYLPAIKKAHELINSGVIGDVQLMTEQLMGGHGVEGYQELAPIHYPLGGPGGAGMGLMDHGIHLIDIFSWFTGSDVIELHGKGQVSGERPESEFLVMRFSNGAVGHLIYNAATYSTALPNEGMFSDGQGWLTDGTVAQAGLWESEPGSICVYGSRGSLRIFHYTNALFLNSGSGPQRVGLDGRAAFGHFATQLEACAQAIFDDKEPPVSGEEGLNALKTALEVYR